MLILSSQMKSLEAEITAWQAAVWSYREKITARVWSWCVCWRASNDYKSVRMNMSRCLWVKAHPRLPGGQCHPERGQHLMTGSTKPLGFAVSCDVPLRAAGYWVFAAERLAETWRCLVFFSILLGSGRLRRRGCFPSIGRNARRTAYFVVLQLIFFQLLWELGISEMPWD